MHIALHTQHNESEMIEYTEETCLLKTNSELQQEHLDLNREYPEVEKKTLGAVYTVEGDPSDL